MLKKLFLVTMCFVVLSGCTKKPSPTGGTVMSSGEIAFFYAPGWVVKKEKSNWRFEHPDAAAWGIVLVSDEVNKTEDIGAYIEREIEKEWGECTVVTREDVDIQGRRVCRTRYRLHYYSTFGVSH